MKDGGGDDVEVEVVVVVPSLDPGPLVMMQHYCYCSKIQLMAAELVLE